MTVGRKPIPSRNDAEALLASLAGVVSAHVVTEAGGRIAEIHILSRAGIHPKQVVRNVESALSAGLGLTVDRRVVSVAQVRSEEPLADSNGHPPVRLPGQATEADRNPVPPMDDEPRHRLEFVRYRSHRQGNQCTCEVVLRSAHGEVLGRGTGANTAVGRSDAAARAVLDGIRTARPDLRVELDGTDHCSSHGRTFVIVVALVLLDRETVRLAGAAALTRSPEEGAIFASLQATNRWSD